MTRCIGQWCTFEVDEEVVLADEGLLTELARQHLHVFLGVEVVPLLLHLAVVVGAEVVLDVVLAAGLGHVSPVVMGK